MIADGRLLLFPDFFPTCHYNFLYGTILEGTWSSSNVQRGEVFSNLKFLM